MYKIKPGLVLLGGIVTWVLYILASSLKNDLSIFGYRGLLALSILVAIGTVVYHIRSWKKALQELSTGKQAIMQIGYMLAWANISFAVLGILRVIFE